MNRLNSASLGLGNSVALSRDRLFTKTFSEILGNNVQIEIVSVFTVFENLQLFLSITYTVFVTSSGNAKVTAFDDVRISASENSNIVALLNSRVIACDNAVVEGLSDKIGEVAGEQAEESTKEGEG